MPTNLRDLPHYATPHTIDLDTDTLLREAKRMNAEVTASKNGTGPFIAFEDYYQRKYKYLYERCPKWFSTIFKADMPEFMNVLENMILKIQRVQEGSLSNYDADVEVGQALFDRYIKGKIDLSQEPSTSK